MMTPTSLGMSRTEQLQDAIGRCEIRMNIARRNLKDCDPADQRKLHKLRGDHYRARDDLTWMRTRLDEALEAGSDNAARREMLAELQRMNMDSGSLFADLEGFGRCAPDPLTSVQG